jgi:ATP-dependent protease ClpP protease subunit
MTWNRLLLLVMASVVIYLGHNLYQRERVNLGRLNVERVGDAVVLEWRSAVDIPMVTRFTEAFDAWQGRTGRFVIKLHSPGGSIREGRELIELIGRIKRTATVDTLVADGDRCASMCVPIYLQGQSRIAGPRARFMFHEPRRYATHTGERVNQPGWEQRAMTQRFFDRYLLNSPMSADWLAQLEREWTGKDIWKTATELVREGSGVVTDLR